MIQETRILTASRTLLLNIISSVCVCVCVCVHVRELCVGTYCVCVHVCMCRVYLGGGGGGNMGWCGVGAVIRELIDLSEYPKLC